MEMRNAIVWFLHQQLMVLWGRNVQYMVEAIKLGMF
jgi:hypothetical protein